MTPTNPTDALTDGQYEVDDYGSIGEAARRICCFCEGDMRRLVYITAKEELAATEARAQGLVDALNGYKAAVAFVAADAWDGCSDCIDVLKAARCADTVESLTPDEIAANLKRIRLHFQPPAKHSQHGGERER